MEGIRAIIVHENHGTVHGTPLQVWNMDHVCFQTDTRARVIRVGVRIINIKGKRKIGEIV